jgi:hypothetical protein
MKEGRSADRPLAKNVAGFGTDGRQPVAPYVEIRGDIVGRSRSAGC